MLRELIVDPVLMPAQLGWSEREYLHLRTKHLVEFTDGVVEVLPIPNVHHQLLVLFLHDKLRSLRADGTRAGLPIIAAFRMKIRDSMYREPDILYMKRENLSRVKNEMWDYADFIVEIVSEGGEHRDYVDKVQAYAEAGVPEYWIADPQIKKIKQLVLEGGKYREVGDFAGEQVVTAVTIPGFKVGAGELFEHAEREMRLLND